MPRPGSGSGTGKVTIKGTRGADDIAVVAQGVVVNGTLKTYSDAQIEAGFIIKAGTGDDRLAGGAGPDSLFGEDGNDWLIGTTADTFDGGAGTDTLDLSGAATAVGVDIQGSGTFWTDVDINSGANGYLSIDLNGQLSGVAKGIENIIGSSFNDWLMGNGLANIIRGGAGDDAISAVQKDGMADQLFGEDGNDELYAGGGNDELTGGAGADKFSFDPQYSDGNWVIHDYSKAEGDKVLLFPYDGDVDWTPVNYLGTPSMQATFDDGDTLTFVGITDFSQIDIAATMAWPGP